jgi:hypothetical protein
MTDTPAAPEAPAVELLQAETVIKEYVAPTVGDVRNLIFYDTQNNPQSPHHHDRLLQFGWVGENGRLSAVGYAVIERSLTIGLNCVEDFQFNMEDITLFKPQNTIQQDLLLLAKGGYHSELSNIRAATLICALHIWVQPQYWKLDGILHWLMKEFVEPGLILQNFAQLNHFLTDAGRFPDNNRSYYVTVINRLFTEIRRLQVRDNEGKNILPFEIPEKDPAIVQLLNSYK